MSKASIGIIGMGVMGKSLALNFVEKGIAVAVHNRHIPGKEENVASQFASQNNKGNLLLGFDSLDDFIGSLGNPRIILLMITAGPAIDEVIKQLRPHLTAGDVIIDGGNSFYKDTQKRVETLLNDNIHYVGLGISGGEEGALKGPSLMPGGSMEGYAIVKDMLSTIAAKDKSGNACSAFIGKGGAGHFVKMVHNGIEYAEMQLLAECYFLLKCLFGFENAKIAEFFNNLSKRGNSGFLIEATIEILSHKEGGEYLLDKILDKSEQKGTGGWMVQAALDFRMPVSTISEAVFARLISSQKETRVELAKQYKETTHHLDLTEKLEKELSEALHAARLINHFTGFDLIRKAAAINGWNQNMGEIARIWTNGCIIRSSLMEDLVEIYTESPEGWIHDKIKFQLQESKSAFANILALGMKNSIALPVMSAALNHLNGMTTANSSANLIQAQRDYFGAHTYQRKDRPEDEYFHTHWNQE